MSAYAYKAVDATGRRVRGRMEAGDMSDLEARLGRLGLDLIDAAPCAGGARSGARMSRRELIAFCFHLEQLLRAGVPLLESLADLRDSLDDPRGRALLATLIDSVEGGKLLSQAMTDHPRAFDGVCVGLVKAGEDSGKLPEILSQLAESLKWQDEMAAHARKLAIYPAFMSAVVLGVGLFALLYLVPRLAGFIAGMGQSLPAHTRLLVAVSDILTAHWPTLLGVPALATGALALAVMADARIRRRFDALKLRLPWVGAILRKIALARLAGVFAMMYAAGIAVPAALRACVEVVGNTALGAGLRQAEAQIDAGRNLSAAFATTEMFPPLVIRMLRIGENSGALDAALLNARYFYDRDVRESTARLLALGEPVMTLAVGLVLGWIMLAVLGPIYDGIAGLRL